MNMNRKGWDTRELLQLLALESKLCAKRRWTERKQLKGMCGSACAIQIVHCANTIYLPIKIHFIIYAEQFLPITAPTHRSLIKLEEKKIFALIIFGLVAMF